MQQPKLQQCQGEQEGVEAEETEEIEAAAEEEADQEPDQVRVKPGSLGPSILTFQLETGRGARCTSNGAKELTSVANQPHVHGRMFTPQSQPTNETGTSSGRLRMIVT